MNKKPVRKSVRKKTSRPKKIAGILKEEFRKNPTRFIMYIIIIITVIGFAVGGFKIKTKFFEFEKDPISPETINAIRHGQIKR